MADAKYDLKRKCMETEDSQPKKRRTDETTGLNNGTKITDVNQFCLEQIFIHLSLEDLLNVADSNAYLKLGTGMPFVWNYAGKSVLIDQTGLIYYTKTKIITKTNGSAPNPLFCDKDITIVDLKTIFQMIRCFGGMITELEFRYYKRSKNNQFTNYHRIMSYIYEFCTESLKKASFDEALGFEGFKIPFKNIEDLTIKHLFGLKEKCLSRVFPNVNRLNLGFCIDDTFSFLSEYFTNLQHLEFNWNVPLSDSVTDILRLNSNLRSFKIGMDDFDVFKRISERYLQSIESLDVEWIGVQKASDSSIYLPNVKKFKYCYYERDVPASKIPFSFNHLEEFEIKYVSTVEIFLTFINENRTIEKLTFDRYAVLSMIGTGQLQNMLPYLKDIIYFRSISDNIDELPLLLSHMEFLRSFAFFAGRTLDEQIRAACDGKWRMNRNNNIVTLERTEAMV
ncbi:uncharacterized protein LOC129579219 isoform X1 [Sitodiplosis mosellana]|uniref:uncharacterized protein LOC129579219 isoform X1 n=1 Tax=Sitodiplosis mosellana TaxID=263140 RepID=UPI0024451D8E|nr:uncharacterized protein LOC129579219 isoform X1 [Sitodiplosis mosellana]